MTEETYNRACEIKSNIYLLNRSLMGYNKFFAEEKKDTGYLNINGVAFEITNIEEINKILLSEKESIEERIRQLEDEFSAL